MTPQVRPRYYRRPQKWGKTRNLYADYSNHTYGLSFWTSYYYIECGIVFYVELICSTVSTCWKSIAYSFHFYYYGTSSKTNSSSLGTISNSPKVPWFFSAHSRIASKFLHLCSRLKSGKTWGGLPAQINGCKPVSAVHMSCCRMFSRQWPVV